MYYVYILTNWKNSVLYVGVTSNLERRIFEHKNKLTEGFSARYNLKKLVYFEEFNEVIDAIENEKKLKGWVRQRKIDLISANNPKWIDLSDSSLRSE